MQVRKISKIALNSFFRRSIRLTVCITILVSLTNGSCRRDANFAMKDDRLYDGRMCGDYIDVFTGPVVPLAIEHAKSVPNGKLRMTSFTAWDTGELIGIDGRSLILKLPNSTAKNKRPYWGMQWFLKGTPQGQISYQPEYIPLYIETTRCWLFDIAVQNNWFTEKPDREAILFWRLKSLNTGHMMRSGGGLRLRPPNGYVDDDSHMFIFDVPHELDIHIGENLPVGIWYAHVKGARVVPGILERASEAPVACVFYLRFQEDHPAASGIGGGAVNNKD